MRRIINGKRYDTETATRVAEWENDYDRGNFGYPDLSVETTV